VLLRESAEVVCEPLLFPEKIPGPLTVHEVTFEACQVIVLVLPVVTAVGFAAMERTGAGGRFNITVVEALCGP